MPQDAGAELSAAEAHHLQQESERAAALAYVEEFCCRRELTRQARRDLLGLEIFLARDIVKALEVDKKDLALQPAEWSKIVRSRVASRAAAGELDQRSLQRIESLMQVSWTH